MLEKVANLPWYWVIVIVIALLGVRYALRNRKDLIGKQVAEIAESLAIAMALVFLIIRPFVVQSFYIPSASMRMGLLEGDHIMVNKFIYRIIREPQRGDVMVFLAPPQASPDRVQRDFIKRLIGLPGDTIRVKAGYVDVGGDEYDHSDLHEVLFDFAPRDRYDIRAKIVKDGVLMNGKKVGAKQIAEAVGKPGAKVTFHPGLVYVNGKPLKEPYTAEDPDQSFGPYKVPKGRWFMMGDNRNMSYDSRYWGPIERWRIKGEPLFRFYPLGRMGLVH